MRRRSALDSGQPLAVSSTLVSLRARGGHRHVGRLNFPRTRGRAGKSCHNLPFELLRQRTFVTASLARAIAPAGSGHRRQQESPARLCPAREPLNVAPQFCSGSRADLLKALPPPSVPPPCSPPRLAVRPTTAGWTPATCRQCRRLLSALPRLSAWSRPPRAASIAAAEEATARAPRMSARPSLPPLVSRRSLSRPLQSRRRPRWPPRVVPGTRPKTISAPS
jgi:hypothetical protein